MGKVLFEIGVEEIPARFIPVAILQMAENFKKITEEHKIEISYIETIASPRRLTLIAEVSSEQGSEEKLVWGPPAHLAFNEEGAPLQPAFAFAKAQGVEISDLQIMPKGKGKYVCAVLKQKGKQTEEIMPDILKMLFFSLSFPKMMRWGRLNLKFVRPVRWFLALYENKIVPFEIEGIKASDITYGHRFLYDGSLRIEEINAYEKALEKAFVIVNHNKREALICEQIQRLAETVGGKILFDKELLEEVNCLVEYPNAVLCSFSEDYLRLPEELLITVMKDHQRYFAITDSDNKLKNFFIVVSNTELENAENIRKGAERVIKARFEDAKFYYEEDLKKGLERMLESTKGIIYHEKLGSLYDRTLRIQKIALKLAKIIREEKIKIVEQAAKYCKADLSSGVVSEFPELQGIMGGYYAQKTGFSDEIATAIREHYLPRGFNDKLPSNELGCILSMADKLEHLYSFFSLGEIPSGTEDPFGLRRAANGILYILLEKKYPLSIINLVDFIDEAPAENIKQQLIVFMSQRFESFLEIYGFEIHLIRTISDLIPSLPVYEIKRRIEAVKEFRNSDNFETFLLAVKRVFNIIRNQEKLSLHPNLLTATEEKQLYEKMRQTEEGLTFYIKNQNFSDALRYMNNLTPFINNFFDNVLVMDKDEEIKRNRIALLQELSEMLKSVADLSKLY